MAITITIAGVAASVLIETLWTEESIDARAICSFTLEDYTNSFTVAARAAVKIVDSGTTIFQGSVMTRTYTQHVSYRIIDVTCADQSVILDERLVGVPGGYIFQGPDSQGNYIAIDPPATTLATDKLTIEALFRNYAPAVADRSTYVTEYVPAGYLGSHPITWSRVTLRSALQDLAAVAGPTVHFWIDPDNAFHWQAFPLSSGGSLVAGGGSLTLNLPETTGLTAAPFGVAEAALVDDVTLYGAHDPPGISITFDGTTMAQQVYVAGVTDFIYTPNGIQTVALPTTGGLTGTLQENVPVVQGGGQGWYPFDTSEGQGAYDTTKRQAIVPSEAVSVTERATDGVSAITYGDREIIRGTATIRHVTGNFHVGQSLQVRFPTALGIDASYAIHRVAVRFLKGDGTRDTTLDFGDAPIGRLTQRRGAPLATVTAAIPGTSGLPRPASLMEAAPSRDVNPLPGSSQPIDFVISSIGGVPITSNMAKTVTFKLFYVRSGAFVVNPPASLSPTSATFTLPGVASTMLTIDASAQAGDKCWVGCYVDDVSDL